MSSGSIGAALRRSQSRKAASAASPSRPAARIGGEVQPRTGPSVSAYTTPARPTAAGGAPGERPPAQPGPGADGRSAVLAPEAGLDDGQAARGEQRSADALEGAGGDQ